MDEMMQGHRGWRELHELGEKGQKLAGMLEGMVRSPKGGNSGRPWDGWSEEVKPLSMESKRLSFMVQIISVIREHI
jgi:protein phosphatase 1G